MKQVDSITVNELSEMASQMYGDFVKAVVDIGKQLLLIDMEMHIDGEQYLLEHGSKQEDIWGINLYPERFGKDKFIEFDSMVNIRPRQQNMSRDVENKTIRQKIKNIVGSKVTA